jgi:glycosyltransferase involved in cell wall biosynthesis
MQPVNSMNARSVLEDVLVVTINKYFWSSPEAQIFPHRMYETRIGKKSENRQSVYFLAARALLYTLRHRPRAILFGSAHRTIPRVIELKRRGFLPGTKLITTNQICFDDADAEYVDKILLYTRSEIGLHDPKLTNKYEFLPYPTDPQYYPFQLARQHPPKRGDYIFCGGVTGRDFASLIEAVRGLDVRLKLVAFSFQALGYSGTLPENCEFLGGMAEDKFMELMANSLFVAVPLRAGADAHGLNGVAQARVMGKAVLTTKNASAEDYVTDGCEGILVAPGDVDGYRQAILRFQHEPGLLDACEKRALSRAGELTYQATAARLANICGEVVAA